MDIKDLLFLKVILGYELMAKIKKSINNILAAAATKNDESNNIDYIKWLLIVTNYGH